MTVTVKSFRFLAGWTRCATLTIAASHGLRSVSIPQSERVDSPP